MISPFSRFRLQSLLFCLSVISASAEEISFNRDIRPILSDKCFFCHGPDKNTREADLRLDDREVAVEMEAIVPGDIEASEAYWRITSDDEDELMPPPDSHKSLTDEEKRLFTKWIEQGAEYEDHWAYLPFGNVDDGSVDKFVSEKLDTEGLKMSPRADDVTLLRRFHFDLTGLPPKPGDLDCFKRIGTEAYVDDLLASPHYGERMAIEWLDAVRYADTTGYHGDQTLEVSPFRDYVIESFNENKPFDQFTIEQIAGDLLPDPSLEQRVAAAYNRLGQSSNEGGIQDAEYLAKYQAERVRTTATAWLGATLACAECHDHKFDPYTTKDFYQFAAYFSDILEKGAWTGDGSYQEDTEPYERAGIVFDKRGPQLEVPTPEEKRELTDLEEHLKKARHELTRERPELTEAASAWADKIRSEMKSDAARDYIYLAEKGEKNEVDTKGWTFINSAKGKVHSGAVARLQRSDGVVQHIANGSKNPLEISEGDVLFSYVWLDPENPPKQVMLQFHKNGSWGHRAWWGEDLIPYGKGANDSGHWKAGELPTPGDWVRLEAAVADLGLKPGDKVSQLAFTQFGGLAYWDTAGIHSSNDKYQWADVPEEIRKTLAKPESEATDAEKKKILAHYRTLAPELGEERTLVSKIRGEINSVRNGIRTVPATISAKRREIRVLPRGNWMDKSGEVVDSGTPHFLPKVEVANGKGTRLELARWIASPENPLTARTFANRLWARFFGNGISEVVDDLGSQGQWPTHPELLDWLAADFVDSGWNVKHLVRTIVLSDTYAQSSEIVSALKDRDPYNRLLARQTGIRLSAELVRDNALAVSGLLNPKVGGRSVKPYQPPGYYQHLNFPRREYQPDTNDEQYRRGLYTHWQRTFLHPAMKAFDAPSREECTMEREHSSTPLQALVLLNDPSYVEAAKVLADGSEDITEMFVKTLTRRPTGEELDVLEKLFASEKARLTTDSEAAKALISVGMKKVETDTATELAAKTAVARTILNLHETITRY